MGVFDIHMFMEWHAGPVCGDALTGIGRQKRSAPTRDDRRTDSALPCEDHVIAPAPGILDRILLVPDEQRTQMPKVALADRCRAIDQLEVGRAAGTAGADVVLPFWWRSPQIPLAQP